MRILVLGAGGIGGYFGARIHDAGGDVTFLTRPARAAQLRTNGLKVFSPCGDTQISPKVVTQGEQGDPFDVIMLSCKSYDLDSAMAAIAPAMNQQSIILPLLNGVLHIDTLAARFGPERVLGGVAFISVMLAPTGEIQHLNKLHRLITGSRTPQPSQWLQPLAQLLASSAIDFALTDDIEQAMWDKIVFLSTLAGSTCTLRASIGDILQTVAGEAFITGLLAECAAVAAAFGHPVAETQLAAYRKPLTEKGSALMASMLRDIERGGATEADHILGDMVCHANAEGINVPLLELAYSHLQAYDFRRRAWSSN
ncbi:2-dehydropantoate 2-reductase [Candidatus Accumulibacter aalborgensis]|uniref:2-dehydropantoate 2-reductase n=1 Tax=Candidatus Accumulibacter aalborgensis TaxID=1860102 RepID=A0A1A8XQL6_9PROT|nr:2-dehydropantoate 2-reductase [Candidatus Accumulibacter aalborgensis]SBT07415.1 2-dehydropantoate 2-reductase [Candidatus Accumulibacter aalborgensis]